MSNHYNQNSSAGQKLQLFSKALKPKANFVQYITIVPLTDAQIFPQGASPNTA